MASDDLAGYLEAHAAVRGGFDLPPPPGWHANAACRGEAPDVFFPTQGEPTAPAKAICAGCPVQQQCLEVHLDEASGIWGGTSARERARLRRARRQAAA